MSEIMVSIICNAYNHEKYIRDALEGFINQKTNFDYEVLIHDDASTDGTQRIIKEYEEKYPHIVKPIYQKTNKYSKGISITQKYQIPRAKGKYLAICEGDDYWIDYKKLQLQVNALENNPTIDMCSHATKQYNWADKKFVRGIAPANKDCILTLKSIIEGGGAYLATSSLLFRKEIELHAPSFRKAYNIDYTLQVSGALNGGIYYINRYMSVYRFLTPESWTKTLRNNHKKKLVHKNKMRKVLRLIDKTTNRCFHQYIRRALFDNYFKTTILIILSIIADLKNDSKSNSIHMIDRI